jgi:hypothetical protein
MAGGALTTASTLQCPHGGTVQMTPSNPTIKFGGAPVVTANDTFIVSGCPFQLPTTPPTPSPCVTVRWTVSDQKVKTSGGPTLSQSSVGLCYSALQAPQGPVVIAATQAQVKSQ